MSDFSFANDLPVSVPDHYNTEYPNFVEFFAHYFEWLYRNGGYTYEEINNLINDKIWLQTNIDRFIYAGNKQYATINKERDIDFTLIELQNTRRAGTSSRRLHQEYLMAREYEFFETSQEEVFFTADDVIFDVAIRNNLWIENWFKKLGLPYLPNGYGLLSNDSILTARLLKSIWDIKGTAQAARLFFMIYFNEDITLNSPDGSIWQTPKDDINMIDYKMVLDGIGQIRDDYLYNEYSMVIYTKYDYAYYKDLFENIYLKYFHPSGFKVFLRQVDMTNDDFAQSIGL